MEYAVTAIEFDFNDDLDPIYSIPKEDQEMITREHLGTWTADDEDDLIEKITENSAWCIRSIDYDIIQK